MNVSITKAGRLRKPSVASKRIGNLSSVVKNLVDNDKPKKNLKGFNKTFTITFGDIAENHVGMQKIGNLSDAGFSLVDLERAKSWFDGKGVDCEIIDLAQHLDESLRSKYTQETYILIARSGLNAVLSDGKELNNQEAKDATDFFNEQDILVKDTHAFMYGRVVEKHARHNLCFGALGQEPDYQNGKGRVIGYHDVPLLNKVRTTLPTVMGSVANDLVAEGNYYYDLTKCGIGYHGDAERRKVVGIRMGETLPLCFIWFQDSVPISKRITFEMNHGDVYMFSQKATGFDWKKKIIPTIRHAAGVDKFITYKAKSPK